MTRDEIIRMAREAGFSQPWTAPKDTGDRLERFAALVAAAERERCAAYIDHPITDTGNVFAAAIRARSKA